MKNDPQDHYNQTKQILLGQATVKPEFKPFIKWLEKTYGLAIANISFKLKTFPNRSIKTPIPFLSITFKYTKDCSQFNNENLSDTKNETKQVIAKKFKETLAAQGLSQADVLTDLNNTAENNKNLEDDALLEFNDFEYMERNLVQRNIPKAKIDALLEKLNNKDIYEVQNNYAGTTFILYTKKQEQEYRDTAEHEKWKDLFFALIQAHNQPLYFERDSLFIRLNSKETLDELSSGEMSNYR